MNNNLNAPKFDVHIHLTGCGCNDSGIWIADSFRKRRVFKFLKWHYKISKQQEATSIDSDWGEMISNMIEESSIDYGVVLGFDGVYSQTDGTIIKEQSQLIIPDKWVFDVCRKASCLLPGPSINPFAKNSVKRLESCIENGAVLIKWMPTVHAIDTRPSKLNDFYSVASKYKIPVLVHMGKEWTFRTIEPKYNDVNLLIPLLEKEIPVICAHTATPILFSGEKKQLPRLRELLEKYPHLWVDNSGMCNPGRFHNLPGLTKDALFASRTLYGSDWPVPSNSFYFVTKLGIKSVARLEKIKNHLDRDSAIKREMGYSDDTLHRAASVLINLDRWIHKV